MKKKINNVAILGGTHGNELTGTYLAKSWLDNHVELQRKSFSADVFIANTQATEQCTRYVDQDLNRSFSLQDLNDTNLQNFENKLAKELNVKLGPKGSESTNFDFIIDLHSTTANMGMTIIIADDDALSFIIAARLQKKNPNIKIVQMLEDRMEQPYITSIVPHAITIEVGHVPQGVLLSKILLDTQKVMLNTLDVIDKANSSSTLEEELEIYNFIKVLDYPKDTEGNISATIHPDLQNKDYKKIKKGDPLFITLNGENIAYGLDTPMYPIFINEAAYYEKGVAMMLTEKKKITKRV